MYAVTSRFFPVEKILGGVVVQTTHLGPGKFPTAHARGVVDPGKRIDAASTVSGISMSEEETSAA